MKDPNRKRPRQVTGEVLSAKMTKTITVQVARLVKHPVYGKYIKSYSRFYAPDEKGQAKQGDTVTLVACRPLSKLKRWRLLEVRGASGGEA